MGLISRRAMLAHRTIVSTAATFAREVIDPNCRTTGRRKHRQAAVIVTQGMIGSMVYIKIRAAKHCPNPKCLSSTLARHHGLSQEYHHLTAALIQ